jgi:hypothetical protein
MRWSKYNEVRFLVKVPYYSSSCNRLAIMIDSKLLLHLYYRLPNGGIMS